MSTEAHDARGAGRPDRVQQPGLGWALRRALLGMVILFVCVAGAAWLLYNSIDPVLEAHAGDIGSAPRHVTGSAADGSPPPAR